MFGFPDAECSKSQILVEYIGRACVPPSASTVTALAMTNNATLIPSTEVAHNGRPQCHDQCRHRFQRWYVVGTGMGLGGAAAKRTAVLCPLPKKRQGRTMDDADVVTLS